MHRRIRATFTDTWENKSIFCSCFYPRVSLLDSTLEGSLTDGLRCHLINFYPLPWLNWLQKLIPPLFSGLCRDRNLPRLLTHPVGMTRWFYCGWLEALEAKNYQHLPVCALRSAAPRMRACRVPTHLILYSSGDGLPNCGPVKKKGWLIKDPGSGSCIFTFLGQRVMSEQISLRRKSVRAHRRGACETM